MTEPKFTPGPWELEDRAIKYIIHKPGEGHITRDICRMDSSTMAAFSQKANAHLIAAAPDLYKALAHLEPYLDAIVCYASTIEEHPPNGFILETKAALAKARGEG